MTEIFHITHMENLPSILAEGGLYCDKETASGRIKSVGIAHAHIKLRRAKRAVEIGAGGTLADYVPCAPAPDALRDPSGVC